MVAGPLMIALALLGHEPARAADSQLMETALRAGCMPSRVVEAAQTDQLTSWIVYCRDHTDRVIVITCQLSSCRVEPARDDAGGDNE